MIQLIEAKSRKLEKVSFQLRRMKMMDQVSKRNHQGSMIQEEKDFFQEEEVGVELIK